MGDDYTQNFYGQAALKLNAFTKADGVFAGWATTPDGEVDYTDGAKLNPTEAMDLYAVWTPAYTVTFAYNDGTTADTTVAIACGTAIGAGAIPQPTRTGYTFGGWFAGATALTADTVIAANTTYTAAWTANTYTVQYLPNGGTGEMAAQTFTYDAEQALTANAFTPRGLRLPRLEHLCFRQQRAVYRRRGRQEPERGEQRCREALRRLGRSAGAGDGESQRRLRADRAHRRCGL